MALQEKHSVVFMHPHLARVHILLTICLCMTVLALVDAEYVYGLPMSYNEISLSCRLNQHHLLGWNMESYWPLAVSQSVRRTSGVLFGNAFLLSILRDRHLSVFFIKKWRVI